MFSVRQSKLMILRCLSLFCCFSLCLGFFTRRTIINVRSGAFMRSDSARAEVNLAQLTDQVKRFIPLSTVMEGYGVRTTPLRPRTFRCLCPFHDDQQPSMVVNDEPGYYYCFSCGVSGNVANFVAKKENISYKEAITALMGSMPRHNNNDETAVLMLSNDNRISVLQQKLNKITSSIGNDNAQEIELSRSSQRDPSSGPGPAPSTYRRHDENKISQEQHDRLLSIIKEAEQYFSIRLAMDPEAAIVRKYLEERGLSAATIAKFGLGYAPSTKSSRKSTASAATSLAHLDANSQFAMWSQIENESVTTCLLSPRPGATAPFASMNELVACGLTKNTSRSESRVHSFYDRFRNRLMIPIKDLQGNTIAFGARTMEDYETSNHATSSQTAIKEAKYINSPTSVVFQKKMVLYGADIARAQSTKLDFVIMVEGYFDVISLYEAGIRNVVASMGTAITLPKLLAAANLTHSGTVVLLLDGDSAGQTASQRVVDLMVKHGEMMAKKRLKASGDNARFSWRNIVLKVANISDALSVRHGNECQGSLRGKGDEVKLKDCADIFGHFKNETRAVMHHVVRSAVTKYDGPILIDDLTY